MYLSYKLKYYPHTEGGIGGNKNLETATKYAKNRKTVSIKSSKTETAMSFFNLDSLIVNDIDVTSRVAIQVCNSNESTCFIHSKIEIFAK